ncbi:DUF1737 domain-containing protein [Pedobacter psychrophilus]|jgi:hypothetical protein|uniref:DUF1737 domain-containing protein n=1 Tax=Pedobacter psychrophilus TaxID=1826909 RepID=UPI000AA035B3|nr:DUF1737 domain-containing protein [Pedobacter psychrophilus]
MKKYDLVIEQELKTFIETVNEAVGLGYAPIGGIIYADGRYIQAIVFVGELVA